MKYVGVAYLPIPETRDPVDPALHIKNYAMAIDGKESPVITLTYPPLLPIPLDLAEGTIVRAPYKDPTTGITDQYYWDFQYAPNLVRNPAYPYRLISESTPMVWASGPDVTLATSPSVYLKVPSLPTPPTFPFKGYWDIEPEVEFNIATQNGSVTAAIQGPLSTNAAANIFALMFNPNTTPQTSKMRRSMRRLVTSTTTALDFYQMGFSSRIGRAWRIRATPLEVGL